MIKHQMNESQEMVMNKIKVEVTNDHDSVSEPFQVYEQLFDDIRKVPFPPP